MKRGPRTGSDADYRVLILAPIGRDAVMGSDVLARAGMEAEICADAAGLCGHATDQAGAILLAEEALTPFVRGALAAVVDLQPGWSDLPVLLLTAPGADSEVVNAALEELGNVTLLERPVRVATLVSAVRGALRARERQYELRDRYAVQSLLAAIVESSDDAMIAKGLDGTILSWNAGAQRIFGYTPEEAVGRSITMLIPPERLSEETTIIESIKRGEPLDHFETVRMTKSGRRLDISLTVSPIRDASNRIIGASKVARDITAQKRAEQALRDADRRKDEFLATLAHELRNPLAPIRNSLALLELSGKDDPTIDHVRGVMERQVNHMVRLVDDLMEVSRITRGRIALRKERVNLADVVCGAVETSQPLIEAAGLVLTIDIREPIMLDADPVRLTQIVANLLNNAAKFSEAGGEIVLSARRDGGTAVLTVRDSGIGIHTDMLPRVFDMFTQVHGDHRGSQSGLGIGLTLVRGLIQLHGGTVTATSDGPGKGSEFTCVLPLAEAAEAGSAPGAKGASPMEIPVRILVVDDNRDAADSMGMLLESVGADVSVVHDGPAALDAIERLHPAVVLLDLGMPGMDGYEVARRVRQSAAFEDVILVALTGWGQEEDRRRSHRAGFDHHLTKPARIEALQAIMPTLPGAQGQGANGAHPRS